MPLYAKPSKELVIDLINQANPQLPFPLTKDTVSITDPVKLANTPGKIQNASVDVIPRAPSGYINKTTVQYRRIDLAALFRGVEIRVDVYTARGTGVVPIRMSDVLPYINQKYGLSLAYEDIQDIWFPAANSGAVPGKRSARQVLRAAALSHAFVGEVTVLWVQGPQDIAKMITRTTLDGRAYPGGNVFEGEHKWVADLETYGFSFSEYATVMNSLSAGTFIGSGGQLTQQQNLINIINELTGKTFLRDSNGEYGLLGCAIGRTTLPSPTFPEANNQFSRLLTLTFPTNHPWGVGKFYLHYDV